MTVTLEGSPVSCTSLDPMLAQLTYGPLAGVLLVGLFALIVVLAQRWWAKRRLLDAATRGWIDAPAGRLEDGEGSYTLRGRLVAEGRVAPFEGPGEAAIAVAHLEVARLEVRRALRVARGLALEVDGERVPIVGEPTLTVGSREARPGASLRRLRASIRSGIIEASEAGATEEACPRFSTLRRDDPVVVVGRLARRATPVEAEYRAAAAGWELRPLEDGTPVQLRFDGRPTVAAPSALRSALLGAVCLGLGLGALYQLGERATDALYPTAGGPLDPEERFDPNLRWAALSPWHVGAAARGLRYRTERLAPYTRALAVERLGFVERAGGCADALHAAAQHGLDEEALALGERCAERSPVAALCRLGRFEEASAAVDYGEHASGDAAVTHLLAGDLAQAAAAARGEAASLRAMGGGVAPSTRSQIAGWSFAADALEARAGDAEARARLEAEEGSSQLVRLLLADLAEGEERRRRAADLWEENTEPMSLVPLRPHLGLLLLAEEDPEAAARQLHGELPRLRIGYRVAPARPPLPVLREALARAEGQPPTSAGGFALRAYLRALRAYELVAQARDEEAAALFRGAEADLDRAEQRHLAQPERGPLAATLHGLRRQLSEARFYAALSRNAVEDARELLSSYAPQRSAALRRAIRDADRGVFDRIRDGDGGLEVARALRPSPLDDLGDPGSLGWFLSAAPSERGALAEHLRWAPHLRGRGCEARQALRRASREVRVAGALEQDDWRTEAEARVRRFDEALARRDTAVLAYLMSSLLLDDD